MKMKKNKIRVISAVVSAIMLASSASAFAKFDAYNDSDGFTLGHYEAEVNQEQRADTEKLYEQRPKNERQFEKSFKRFGGSTGRKRNACKLAFFRYGFKQLDIQSLL